MHYPGYAQSRRKVAEFSRDECIDLIESLYGWDWGEDGVPEYASETVSLEVLRAEALRQHDREWTVPFGQEHHYTLMGED